MQRALCAVSRSLSRVSLWLIWLLYSTVQSEAIGIDDCSRGDHSDVSDMGECEQVGDFPKELQRGVRGEVVYIQCTLSSGKGGYRFSARLLFFPHCVDQKYFWGRDVDRILV